MIETNLILILVPAIFAAAVLYSSVGHGGASGYLAVMALAGLAPAAMKPAVLTMNIFVTILVFARLYRAGHFKASLFAPFALASMPMAFIGGTMTIEANLFRVIIGAALLLAAIRMFVHPKAHEKRGEPNWLVAAPIGAILGLVAGLTGVGGGIYLSPIVLLLGWTNMRESAAIAAAFILLNSVAGLAGFLASGGGWPQGMPYFIAAAVLGGAVGSELGARSASPKNLRYLLGVVLLVAGAKMIATP